MVYLVLQYSVLGSRSYKLASAVAVIFDLVLGSSIQLNLEGCVALVPTVSLVFACRQGGVTSISSDTVYMGGLAEEIFVNPLTHGILMRAFKWAMDGVSDYLHPEHQGWLRREGGGVRGDVKQVRVRL